MQTKEPAKHRFFTEESRIAALAARRAKAALPKEDDLTAVVVRDRDDGKAFQWQIRQFGGMIIRAGDDVFTTHVEAIEAGRRALAEERLTSAKLC